MEPPSEFIDTIEPDHLIKFEGQIEDEERIVIGDVFNTRSVEEQGIEVDVTTAALPDDEFYTLLFADELREAELSEDSIEVLIQGRETEPESVGTVRKLMIYEPLDSTS